MTRRDISQIALTSLHSGAKLMKQDTQRANELLTYIYIYIYIYIFSRIRRRNHLKLPAGLPDYRKGRVIGMQPLRLPTNPFIAVRSHSLDGFFRARLRRRVAPLLEIAERNSRRNCARLTWRSRCAGPRRSRFYRWKESPASAYRSPIARSRGNNSHTGNPN